MENKPIISLKGEDGRVELFEDMVKIRERSIPIREILSLKIKRPGSTPGFLHFSLEGNIASREWTIGCIPDENTLCFLGKEEYDQALDFLKYFEMRNK
ncbi:MAG: hypothetical protein NTZ13_02220 [Candidatus Parcubacteria bacterium]|nr:hypothetical protein [Candidatus Parcubacteria bacterium]